jgi:hypothetical protein
MIKPLFVMILISVVLSGGCAMLPVRQEEPSAPAYQVGDRGPSGGTVIHDKGFLSDRWRYIEAAPLDLDYSMNWFFARDEASQWEHGDYGDWRLPTLEELRWMYELRDTIDAFSRHGYWSASEDGVTRAWEIRFDTGQETSAYKYTYSRVRAVRMF